MVATALTVSGCGGSKVEAKNVSEADAVTEQREEVSCKLKKHVVNEQEMIEGVGKCTLISDEQRESRDIPYRINIVDNQTGETVENRIHQPVYLGKKVYHCSNEENPSFIAEARGLCYKPEWVDPDPSDEMMRDYEKVYNGCEKDGWKVVIVDIKGRLLKIVSPE